MCEHDDGRKALVPALKHCSQAPTNKSSHKHAYICVQVPIRLRVLVGHEFFDVFLPKYDHAAPSSSYPPRPRPMYVLCASCLFPTSRPPPVSEPGIDRH